MRAFLHSLRGRKPVSATPEERNEYYENISANLGIFQVILYLSLFAFVILSFAKNTNLITYQNFYYFFKDLNASMQTVETDLPDSVTYPTDTEQSITLFRQGVAVAGNHNVTVFTATGRQTVSQIVNFSSPVAVASDKYLLVYDLGGTKYALYNSYTQVYSGESDYPILGASISDAGSYALITQSKDYASVVSLYSNHFTLIGRYQKKGYVMDVAINEKGNLLAILASEAQNGFWSTSLELFKPGEREARAKTLLDDSVGLACAFTASDTVSVLSENTVFYVKDTGKIVGEHSLDGREVTHFELGEYGVSVLLRATSVSEKNTLMIFDKNGKILYNEEEPERSEQMARTKDAIYLLTVNGVGRIDLKNKTYSSVSCKTQDRRLLAVDRSEFLLCSPQKAEYYQVGS